MDNGLTVNMSISAVAVFAQGLISFFSPCVLPLLPMYIGYLAGGTTELNASNNIAFKKSKVIINTLFFVIGISTAFILMGLAATKLGSLFNSNKENIIRAGGIIIFLFGLFQIGIFESQTLNTEKRFKLPVDRLSVSPLVALLLGFTFSFAWTPCVGPMLTSVLLMAGATATFSKGMILVAVYTLGFVIPFILTGLFTTSLLSFFKKHSSVVQYTKKLGGLIMIIIGILMFAGMFGGFSINKQGFNKDAAVKTEKTDKADVLNDKEDKNKADEDKSNENAVPAIDIEAVDQYGNTQKLSDYKGKTVLLNFWATWCPPCRKELPDIQEVYEERGENADDVVILGVVAPSFSGEKDIDGIKEFLKEKNVTYPILMNEDGGAFYDYHISAFPTTFLINKEGNVEGYLTGGMSKNMINDILDKVLEGSK